MGARFCTKLSTTSVSLVLRTRRGGLHVLEYTIIGRYSALALRGDPPFVFHHTSRRLANLAPGRLLYPRARPRDRTLRQPQDFQDRATQTA